MELSYIDIIKKMVLAGPDIQVILSSWNKKSQELFPGFKYYFIVCLLFSFEIILVNDFTDIVV